MWPEYEEIINAQTSPLSCAMWFLNPRGT
jgi:hypothetical protein